MLILLYWTARENVFSNLETDIANLDQPLQVSQGRRKTQPDNTAEQVPPITATLPQREEEVDYSTYWAGDSPDTATRNAMIETFGQTQQQANPALNALKAQLRSTRHG